MKPVRIAVSAMPMMPVEANRQARLACVLQLHRNADRVASGRELAEQQEGTGAVRHQVFPVFEAEVCRHAGHRRGEDQQEHVVQRVAQVEQERGSAVELHGGDGGRSDLRVILAHARNSGLAQRDPPLAPGDA